MKLKLLLLTIMATLGMGINAQSYYMSKTVDGSYTSIVQRTKDVLKDQGFGVMTEIQMDNVLKEKLGEVDMNPYLILGVCNPKFAYETVKAEENIGLFLPCKVVIKKISDSQSEVVFINPSVVMKTIGNTKLDSTADQVTERFKEALEKL